MMAEVAVNAIAPAAKAKSGLILVARDRRRSASLSVSSATNIVPTMVKKPAARPEMSNAALPPVVSAATVTKT